MLGSGPRGVYRIRGIYQENEATFFLPHMEWEVASTSNVHPDERQFLVHSSASVRVMSTTDLTREELKDHRSHEWKGQAPDLLERDEHKTLQIGQLRACGCSWSIECSRHFGFGS